MNFLKLIATSFFLLIGVVGICALQKHFITHTNGKIVPLIIISPNCNETSRAIPGHSYDFELLDDCILEEDNDDVCTSGKKKFTSEKLTFITISFVSPIFFDNSSNKIRSTEYFNDSYPHSFISLNVFRL